MNCHANFKIITRHDEYVELSIKLLMHAICNEELKIEKCGKFVNTIHGCDKTDSSEHFR